MPRRVTTLAMLAALGCSSSSLAPAGPRSDGGLVDAAHLDAGPPPPPLEGGASLDAGHDAGAEASAPPDATPACTTRVSYGSAWVHPAGHPSSFDDTAGLVTWDGVCADDGPSSYAVLSNGWKPYFQGHGACVIALDSSGCGVSTGCTTRVTYGTGWLAPAGHAASYDDVVGRVFSDGVCVASGAASYMSLSNGWQPHFQGTNACRLSFEYTQCGGLYENPVIPFDCPDPGVIYAGGQYVLVCTSGDAPDAYPMFTSPDLVSWTAHGHVFPSGHWPSWAVSDFWAPEVHKVGSHYVVYFSARNAGGQLSIGAASAPSPLGPFTDVGHPLIQQSGMGLIDASEINAADGTPYVLWKEDGNAIGQPTPIHAAILSSDGLSLAGAPATLITNDEAWEGSVTEAPFMVSHGGSYFLFYSGNSYAGPPYAVGVARASSPLGPFSKLGAPIVVTGGAWVGPGHCAVIDTPTGDTYMVYAAWQSGCVNAPGCGRMVLTDALSWGAWPSVPFAPSSASRPMP